MLIIVGENKKHALLRCVFTGWYYEVFMSAQDKIISTGLSLKTERPLMKLSMLLNLSSLDRRVSHASFIQELKEISIR